MGTLPLRPWWRRPTREQRSAALSALEQVGLAGLAHETFGDLSGGQRQRVLIARALVQDADLLLLDEPFTGLDAQSAQRLEALVERLARDGRAVMIATHDLPQARSWDRVLCLNRVQIAFGEPRSVLTTDVLQATYGGDLVQLPDGGRPCSPRTTIDRSAALPLRPVVRARHAPRGLECLLLAWSGGLSVAGWSSTASLMRPSPSRMACSPASSWRR